MDKYDPVGKIVGLITYILNNIGIFLRVTERTINAGDDKIIRTSVGKMDISSAFLSGNYCR